VSAVYCALVHHPVRDREKRIVTTAVTNLDVHDLARDVLRHRLVLSYDALADDVKPDGVDVHA